MAIFFKWAASPEKKETEHYVSSIYQDYFFIKEKEGDKVGIYFKGKGFAPQLLSEKLNSPLKNIIFIDDSRDNLTLFEKQIKKTEVYKSLENITLYYLKGDSWTDGLMDDFSEDDDGLLNNNKNFTPYDTDEEEIVEEIDFSTLSLGKEVSHLLSLGNPVLDTSAE